jgi:hypothetical protein
LKVFHRPDPFLGRDCSKVDLLLVQVRRQVGAHQAEERGDRKGLVAVSDDFKVDTVAVVVKGEEGDGCVDGDHEEDANDVFLLPWLQVSSGVHEDEEEGHETGDGGEYASDPEPQGVKGVAIPNGLLRDAQILLCGIAFWPAHLGRFCA